MWCISGFGVDAGGFMVLILLRENEKKALISPSDIHYLIFSQRLAKHCVTFSIERKKKHVKFAKLKSQIAVIIW